jgi:hypothetical protein
MTSLVRQAKLQAFTAGCVAAAGLYVYIKRYVVDATEETSSQLPGYVAPQRVEAAPEAHLCCLPLCIGVDGSFLECGVPRPICVQMCAGCKNDTCSPSYLYFLLPLHCCRRSSLGWAPPRMHGRCDDGMRCGEWNVEAQLDTGGGTPQHASAASKPAEGADSSRRRDHKAKQAAGEESEAVTARRKAQDAAAAAQREAAELPGRRLSSRGIGAARGPWLGGGRI